MKPRLVAIVGSTASGKSDLAMRLARETGAEILSCDSLLVYKGLTIGTAKPSDDELAEVRHHGVDLVELDQPFTAGDYVRYARPIVDKAVAENRPLLIVGGTGFYLKALVCGTWDAPPTNPGIRAKIESEVASLAPDERAKTLHARLVKLDPAYAAKLMVNDVYRVVRALEIIELSGEPVTSMLAKQCLQNPLPYEVPLLGIRRGSLDLDRRIVERTNAMFSKGLVGETKELLRHFAGKGAAVPRPFFCVGYKEVMEHLEGDPEKRRTLPETRERIVIATRQLAKKQLTFFKGQFTVPIEWYDLPDRQDAIMARAREVLNAET
ncbi:MAG: tRNA (adenosine(37)-N6)-dimethylallyltransferase MiaA [Deltaproteobacteria bacterium]|nr:tRNA (adenosine(37)-N6)-dimethylallyltransferase MiaA [Deltaproteobacteria bacterium]